VLPKHYAYGGKETLVSKNTNTETQSEETATGFNPITSQEEFDKILGQRLQRERSKYADYEDLKQKAAKLDQIEEANKTELEKALARAEKAEAHAKELETREQLASWKQEVSRETGVPADILRGSTLEELQEHAKQVKPLISDQKNTGPVMPGTGEIDNKNIALNGEGLLNALKTVVGAR